MLTQPASRKAAAVIGWMLAGAALGAVGGALFGLLFGSPFALVHGDESRLIWLPAYFALCGAVAGVLAGGFGSRVEAIGLSRSRTRFCASPAHWRQRRRHGVRPAVRQRVRFAWKRCRR